MNKIGKGFLLGGFVMIFAFLIILFIGNVYSAPSQSKVKVVVQLRELGGGNFEGYAVDGRKERMKQIVQKFGTLDHVFLEENAFSIEIERDQLDFLKKEFGVKEVRELRIVRAFLQDSVGIVNATQTWSVQRNGINITGSGEVVCIIDTGVNFSHPDLQGKNATPCTIDCRGQNCISNCSVTDDHGHGTHVAGIVGANGTIKGVAPDARILAVKVLDSAGVGTEADLKAGIDFCVSNASLYNISVISMSLGTDSLYTSYCDGDYSGTPNITKSVNDAMQRNISVIAATGQPSDGSPGNKTAIAAPACIRNVTAVTRSNKDNTAHSSPHSNNITDLIAPGSSISSTCVTGGSCIKSGTSMSTPHVAAAFTLLRQFKRLESNKILPPLEIENELKKTGKLINDSNGLNFSRIDIYTALLSLQNPTLALVSPLNGTRIKGGVNFTCNASTDSSSAVLANITFLLYNGTVLLYNETKNISGGGNQTTFNYTFSQEKEYFWGCRASDNRSYTGVSQNFTVTYDATVPLITVVSPENITYKDGLFNVSLNENISWCGYSLDHGSNVSMTRYNDTYFNATVTNISVGIHNVSFSCNDTAGNFNATSLRQFTINRTLPVVVLISPAGGYSANVGSLDFKYNVTHSRNISSCSLLVDDANVSTNTSVNTSSENNFSYTASAGSHTWNINCTDDLGNIGNASSRSFTLNAPSVGVSGGGGGGGSPVGGTTHVLTENELRGGTSKQLAKDDRIKFFLIEKGKNVTHYINITNVTSSSASFVVYSLPQRFALALGEVKKLELTEDNYLDLYVRLNMVVQGKANVSVQVIHELIPNNETPLQEPPSSQQPREPEGNRTIRAFEPEGEDKGNEQGGRIWSILVLISLVILLAVIALFLGRRKGRKLR